MKKHKFTKECPYNCQYNKHDGKGKEGCSNPHPPKYKDIDCFYYLASGY